METSSVLLVCMLVTCSVWTVHGRSFEVSIDDLEQMEVEISVIPDKEISVKANEEISVQAGKLPGVCWACKWALNKVKKVVGANATVEKLTSKLNSVCNQIGLLKALCRKFVKTHLAELIEELTTTDDVRTICVNTGACKPKELLDLLNYPSHEDPHIKINEYA
ncbi:antimicrobial peptide NK-lysin [Plectropomus leopardus]|uniref:antimicrobial peptide NK-lysin n=1 Tax=Plectropomus leopardus TaxID=160734 RepID=UPI001C4BF85F|nr:antimicrobial peptide NK-lysin [Plectropomus leopardus]